jgi:hypothetical protein
MGIKMLLLSKKKKAARSVRSSSFPSHQLKSTPCIYS